MTLFDIKFIVEEVLMVLAGIEAIEKEKLKVAEGWTLNELRGAKVVNRVPVRIIQHLLA